MSTLHTVQFSEIAIGQLFRIPGWDDTFRKVSQTHAKDLGCGLLTRPARFARKGQKILVSTIGADASGFQLV